MTTSLWLTASAQKKVKLEFNFRLIPTLGTLALLPALLGLAFWQLDRAEQKLEIQQLYDNRSDLPAIAMGSAIEDSRELEYHRVRAAGTWDPNHEFLLDNRVRRGQPGFHVITPLVFRSGQSAVLVNRGWIPGSPDRSQLPDIPATTGDATVTGTAVVPPTDTFLLEDPPPIQPDNWPIIWQAMDIERFASAVPYQVQGVVVLLDDLHPDGFERAWPPPDTSWIARHKAYAFQWFALSATLLVIYFLLAFRPRRK